MKKTTKIVIVTPWFGEFAGGAEVQAKSLAIEFNKRGVETIVFTTCCKSPYSDWWHNDYEEGEYEVYGLKTFRFSVNDTKEEYEDALGHFIHHKDQMTERRYENFFVAGINSGKLVKGLEPYIYDGYEVIAMPYYQGLTHSVARAYPRKVSIIPCFHDEEPFYWRPVEYLLDHSKHIFFNSYEEKALAIKAYGEKIGRKLIESIVTGEGVELKENDNDESTINTIPENYFIYMGRKEEGKNVHLLVKWFDRYISVFDSQAKLVFIGGGDASLVSSSENYIDYGFVSEADKKHLLENATALINMSENESFSIVIMEAWLYETPVIVHGDCDVTKGHTIRSNGGLYPSSNDEFNLCLRFLKENKSKAKHIGMNGKRYVEQNMTYDNVLEKYLTILEQK